MKLKVDAAVMQRDSDNIARREEDRKQVMIGCGCCSGGDREGVGGGVGEGGGGRR